MFLYSSHMLCVKGLGGQVRERKKIYRFFLCFWEGDIVVLTDPYKCPKKSTYHIQKIQSWFLKMINFYCTTFFLMLEHCKLSRSSCFKLVVFLKPHLPWRMFSGVLAWWSQRSRKKSKAKTLVFGTQEVFKHLAVP